MLMVNIQLLTDRDYARAIPEEYVINVKDVQMTRVVVQIAKKLASDTSKVFHFNTEKFAKTHEDAIEGELSYMKDPDTGHIELIASAPMSEITTDILTPILGRMRHRTIVMASKMESEKNAKKRATRNKNKENTNESLAETNAAEEIAEANAEENTDATE